MQPPWPNNHSHHHTINHIRAGLDMSLKAQQTSPCRRIDRAQEGVQYLSSPEAGSPQDTEASKDFKFMEHVPVKDDRKLKAESCKPSTLRYARRSRQKTARTNSMSSTSITTGGINGEIDYFLSDVKNNGFVLPATESTIKRRLSLLENDEHVLSPIQETPESYPGGFNPMTLTYSLPQVNFTTKPTTVEATQMTPKLRRERPSATWSKLGSSAYHFVGEGRFSQK